MNKEEKKGFRLPDAALIIAGLSAIIYYSSYVYQYGYYQYCTINVVDLHYTFQDMLFASPVTMVVLAAFSVALLFSLFRSFSDPAKEFIKIEGLQIIIIGLVSLSTALLLGLACYFQGRNMASQMLASKTYEVTVDYDNKLITGYSYLTRNEDSYYLFKTVADTSHPEILILRANKVEEMISGTKTVLP
jgi:hypothetical protein